MNREELAYIAGLYEGEGTMNASGDQGKIWIQIRMTDREPVELVHRITGLGKAYGPYDMAPPRKPLYVWRVNSFEEAQAFVALIGHWLSPRRRAQAERMLRIIAESVARPGRQRRVRYQARRRCLANCCNP